MNFSFSIKEHDGLHSGLYMQITPGRSDNNPDYLNSIVIDETAFALIERFFLKAEGQFAHWGITYLNRNKTIAIRHSLEEYRTYLLSKDKLMLKDEVMMLSTQALETFIHNFKEYKADAIAMLDAIISFLNNVIEEDIDGVTV